MMFTVVLGNQLFESWFDEKPAETEFAFVESREMAARFRYHKHKLILIFSAMRKFSERLSAKGFKVHYLKLDDENLPAEYFKRLEYLVKKRKKDKIRISEIADRGFKAAFQAWASKTGIELIEIPSRLFLTDSSELRSQLDKKRPFMKSFYEFQRKRLKILVEKNGTPTGGQWSFDTENRKKLPKDYVAPYVTLVPEDSVVAEVSIVIEKYFPDHPGSSDHFWIPTDRKTALKWMYDFFEYRFGNFGPYEDAIQSGGEPSLDFLNHSVLSPLINIGILTPEEVVDAALMSAKKYKTPLSSVEGFIRQIIGWREFVKGIDLIYGERQAQSNFFKHQRKLKSCWYEAKTGLPPVDEAIRKAVRRGYNHHIERLMILSNVMLLTRVNPQEVYRWFMEMYVDAYEWVMGPNVYGMGQFSDGGIFATKPYICGSNYILKMSDYKKGEWCKTWDGLYWSFIDDNRSLFLKNPRSSMMVHLLDKMSPSVRSEHKRLAREFIERTTR